MCGMYRGGQGRERREGEREREREKERERDRLTHLPKKVDRDIFYFLKIHHSPTTAQRTRRNSHAA